MPRTPLKDIQTDGVTTPQMMKQTPDKCRDQAAASTAARLLNSAKKSLTKQCAKRVKLSLRKPPGDAACSKPSAKGLTFSSKGSDLNDSMEFKGGMPLQTMPKFSLTTRKRKTTIQDDKGKRTKLMHHDPDLGIKTSNQNTRTEVSEEDVKTKGQSISRTRRHKKDDARIRKNVDVDMPLSDTEQPCSSSSKEDVRAASHRRFQSESSECDYSEGARTADTEEVEGSDRCEKDLSTSLHTCPACGKMLKRGRFVRHIQLCIKQHCDEKDEDGLKHLKDKEPLHSSKREAAERAAAQSDEVGTESLSSESEYVFCQLCQKDLSHLNSHRRTLHINSCIDQEEKKKEEEKERERALEAAKTQVLDCPMCGKVLRTLPSRNSHLKKCAANLGVGPDQLLEAVRHQEEQHRATLAAGILPDSGPRPGRNTRQNSTSSRRGVGTLPKSKLDEDTQLALALSTSMKPDTADTHSAPALQPKRGRRKKQEEDYMLVTLTPNQAAGRIETRVSDLIMLQVEEEEENVPPLPQLKQDVLREHTVCWSHNTTTQHSKMFWRLSSIEEGSVERGDGSRDSLQYYVSALMPPVTVSSVVVGSKVRRMSEIPGRRRSQETSVPVQSENCDQQGEEGDAEEEETDTVLPFSTQTAEVLADLAAEADGMGPASQLSSQSHIVVVSEKEHQAQQEVLSAMSAMVNQREWSDVVIVTADSTSLYAHRLLLSARCPALLQMMNGASGTIDLTDQSPQCVLALLRFIYAGVTQVPHHCLPGVSQLAHRFGLTLFYEICQQQMEALNSPVIANDMETEELQLISIKPLNTSVTSCLHTSDKTHNVRNKHRASAPQTYVSHEEDGPPVLEKCHDPDSPPNIDFIEDVNCENHVSGQNPMVFNNLEDSLNISTHTNRNSTEDVSQNEIKFFDDEGIDSAQRVVQSSPTVEKRSVATDNEENGNAGVVIAVDNGAVIPVNKQKQDSGAAREEDAWSAPDSVEALDAVSSVGPGHTVPVTKRTGEGESISSQSHDNSAEHAGIMQSPKPGTNIEPQMKSDGENQEKSQPSATNLQRDSVAPYNQLGAALSKHCDPVDSIEISDDDLFSSDDVDIASVSNSPTDFQSSLLRKCSHHSAQRDTTKDTTPNSSSTSEALQNSISSSPDSVCSQKIVQNGDGKKSVEKSEESESVERTRQARGCFTVDESPEEEEQQLGFRSSLSSTRERRRQARGRFTVDESPEEGEQQSRLGNNLSSTSMSTIEGSYQHSPSSAHPAHFHTSTPELSAPHRHAHRMVSAQTPRQACGSGSHDITVIPKSTADDTDATCPFSKDHVDETCSRDLDRDSANRPNSGHQTPGVSVVLQESLYITPVEQSNARTTFQLVTPLLQPTSTSFPKTPVSCHPPQASSGLCSDSFVSQSNQTVVEGVVSEDPNNKKECSESHDQLHDTNTKMMDDSDSDLEIIESSLQDAPSPKFSLQSRLGSSQPLSQTTPQSTQCLSRTTSRSSHTQSQSISKSSQSLSQTTPKPSQTQTHPTLKPSQSYTAPKVSQCQSHTTPRSSQSMGQATPNSALHSRQEKQVKSYTQQSKNTPHTQSPGRTQSHSPSLHHHTVRGRSPARDSPIGSQGRFSQTSADSDKDLLRITDLVCGQEVDDQHATVPGSHGKEDEAVEKSIADEDVWEDFNNMDDYNPDFFLGVLDPNNENIASPDKTSLQATHSRRSPSSPHSPATSPFPSPLKTTSDPPRFKTPTKSHKSLKDTSHKQSSVKSFSISEKGQTSPQRHDASSKTDKRHTTVKFTSSDYSRQPSLQKQTASSKTSIKQTSLIKIKSTGVDKTMTSTKESVTKPFKKQPTPVKVRPSGLDKTPTPTRESQKQNLKSSDVRECLKEDETGAGFEDERGAGFFMVDEDTEAAANSSFLWSEENAPTEESDFMSAALDLGREEIVSSQGSQRPSTKTPTVTKAGRKGGKSWGVPPSPFTPMPAYDNMTTPNLKTEVQKYGLKPVGKKRMKMVLKDIYHKTHQYETDSDCEDDMHLPNLDPPVLTKESDTGAHPLHTQPPPVLHKHSRQPRPNPAHKQSKKGKSTNAAQERTAVGEDVTKDPPGLVKVNDASKPVKRPKTKRGLAQKSKEESEADGMEKSDKTATGRPSAMKQPDQSTKPASLSPYKATQGGGRGKQKRAHIMSDTHSVPDSSSPEKSFSSQDSEASELPDVSVFEEGRLELEDGEDITPSQQLASADLPERLMVFFQSHPVFYHKILTYEPLDLGVVREDLKASGIKCSQQKLLDFLDEKCITFTTKNMVTRKQRRRGKKSPVKKPRNPPK